MLKRIVNWARRKSVWVFHVNTGSCNNCDIEIIDALTSRFDAERLGVTLVGSPEHADMLLVTGVVTRQAVSRLKEVYKLVPAPKKVVAVGTCAVSGGIFRRSYNFAGPVNKIIPVDVYVSGCPPRPQEIISGIVKAIGVTDGGA